jgi:hypothetical protein
MRIADQSRATSMVYHLTGSRSVLEEQNPSGKFKFSGNCVEGYGLQFIPEYGSIYFQKVVFCKEALAEGVKLKRIPMPETAKLNAAIVKEVESDPGSAASVSNLFATKVCSKAEALSYKITTLVQWGKFLNVEKPMIYNGEDWFMPSEELVKATKTFQKGKGLIVTGAIDSKTLESAADVTKLGEILKKQ